MKCSIPFSVVLGKVIPLLLLLPLATGCPILDANFNGDIVDDWPDETLPGGPQGDSLTFDQANADVIVRSEVGDLKNKPVTVNAFYLGTESVVALRATVAGTPPNSGRWKASWRAIPVEYNDVDINSSMVLRDSSDHVIATVTYRSGGIIDFGVAGAAIDETWTEGVSRLYEVNIDMGTRTVGLSIDGTPVPTCQNLAFQDSGVQDLAHLDFQFNHALQVFALDDLKIAPAQARRLLGRPTDLPVFQPIASGW